MSGQDDPGLATLPPDSRLLRTFDLGAVAFRALAAERPLAILIDDLQWSDEDSLRLLRYVVRTDRREPDLPDVRDPSRGVRVRHRGREPGGRHGPRWASCAA